MDDQKSPLITNMLASTKIDRREFIRTAVATGVTISMATSLWSSSALASTPKRGGTFVQGMEGSSATSNMDPTTWTNTYDANVGYCSGQRLIANDPVSGDYTFELATAIDSPDGGLTWKRIAQKENEHFGGYFHPSKKGWIYMTCTEGAQNAGLYLSRDNGKTWTPFTTLPFSNIHRVHFNPRDKNRIYLSTFGASVLVGPDAPVISK